MNLPDFKDFVSECLTDDFKETINESINKQLRDMDIPNDEKELHFSAFYSLALLNRYHEWLKQNL